MGDSVPEGSNAVLKALEVLDLLGDSDGPLNLKDIVQTLGYPASTVHRMLANLVAKGYVRQSQHDRRYHLGWKFVIMARKLGNLGQLPQIILPDLRALARKSKLTVNLGMLHNSKVLYVDSIPSPETPSMYSPPGSMGPIHATAIGKVLLSYLDESERDALLPQLSLESYTPNTITSLQGLRSELSKIIQLGYGIDCGEWYQDIYCIAAPIKNAQERAVSAVSITARSIDLAQGWEERLSNLLIASCKNMERLL